MSKITLHQTGETLTLTIPAHTIERLGLKDGQELTVLEHEAGFELVTSAFRLNRQMTQARKVLQEQAETLRALADL